MVEQATGEVRFAVVLYGGVSLAIYMNGITQELLRMVRGSSDLPDEALDEGERIYRALSHALAGPRGGRKRFVIDIISGTSAGGINGVALAKALALGSKDMQVLRQAWTDKADIGQLLNDRVSHRFGLKSTQSLLDGGHMYDVLLDTIGRITGDGHPLAEMVDLFVTATDLHGLPAPIHLTGARLDEKIHKTVFHFAYDSGRQARNDFTPDNDAMLAFAARCTSSFPVAFAPMRFTDMPQAAQVAAFSRFFPQGFDHRDRLFADGGYLDNRPFSHAIDLIPFRPTTLPGERKLLFIDPFPEQRPDPDPRTGAVAVPAPQPVDFLQNAQLAAMKLPRTEVIRDDIRAITRMNRRLERLGTLQARWRIDQQQAQMRHLGDAAPAKPDNLALMDLADQVGAGYGSSYPLYHHLRVYDTTDTLTGLVARLAGYVPDSDEALYLRQILRAWRDAHFAPYHEPGRQTESVFLSQFDIGFRLRRLIHLRAAIDARLQPDPDQPLTSESLTLLRGARAMVEGELAAMRRLAAPLAADSARLLDPAQIETLRGAIAGHYGAAMQQPTLTARYALADAVYRMADIRPLVDLALARLGDDLRQAFEQGSARIREGLALLDLPALSEVYETFHWHDVITYPFLEGSDLQEHSQVQVFRISPADSTLNGRPDKLAGIKIGAFGGFLDRDWREHDILWGRLDGAERIVAALMSDHDEAARAQWTERLQDQILREEFGAEAGQGRRLALLKAKLRGARIDDDAFEDAAAQALGVKDPAPVDLARFQTHYRDFQPLGPDARRIAGWASRSMRVLSRMIDGLPDDGILRLVGRRAASVLRAGGGLMAGLARFALPGSYWRLTADKMLFLAMAAGLMLAVLGLWAGPVVTRSGLVLMGAGAALWLVLYAFGRWLRGKVSLPRAVLGVGVIVGLGLMIVGAVTVANHLFG